MIALIVLVYFVFILLFILRISIIMRKLNNSQESRNFQEKSNLIEQDRRSFKSIITFYCSHINRECFATIETRI